MPKHTVCTTLAAALELVHAGSEKVLELDRWVEIGDSGATELASALRTNETLEVLILGSQNIGPAGAQVRFCFESIRKQTRHVLTVFCMGGRVAGHAASSSFVSLPQLYRKRSPNATSSALSPNGITAWKHQALGDAIRKNMKLKELHLHNNKLGYEGVEKLCEELAKPLSKASSRPGNKIIEALVLRSNGIGKHCEGDKVCGICRFSPEFPTALLELTSLHLIDLNHNVLTYVPLEIAKLPKLMGLDLRNNTIANIPEKVMVTARCGHQSGFLELKSWMLGEIKRIEDPDSATSAVLYSEL